MPQCLTPLTIYDANKVPMSVPCGRCLNCKRRLVSEWSFRLMQQERVSESAYFITLTYDTTNATKTKNGLLEINRRDLQLWLKRLRKAHGKNSNPIKYFAVGEYGTNTERPHYHIILFNCKIELVQPTWQLGHVHYGEVTGASVGYTLKYVMKDGKIPKFKGDDRTPEFRLMSKNWAQPILRTLLKNGTMQT